MYGQFLLSDSCSCSENCNYFLGIFILYIDILHIQILVP